MQMKKEHVHNMMYPSFVNRNRLVGRKLVGRSSGLYLQSNCHRPIVITVVAVVVVVLVQTRHSNWLIYPCRGEDNALNHHQVTSHKWFHDQPVNHYEMSSLGLQNFPERFAAVVHLKYNSEWTPFANKSRNVYPKSVDTCSVKFVCTYYWTM